VRRHLVHVYDDEASFLARVGGFLSEGARNGDELVLIATPEHARQLRPYVRGPAACHVVDARQTLERLMHAGQVDEARFHRVVGGLLRPARASGRRLRAYGQLVQLLGNQGRWHDAVRLEQMWNQVGRTHESALLCGFSLISFLQAHSRPRSVCVEHQDVAPPAHGSELYALEPAGPRAPPSAQGVVWQAASARAPRGARAAMFEVRAKEVEKGGEGGNDRERGRGKQPALRDLGHWVT